MKRYAVEITENALADMAALYEYRSVKLLSPHNAMGQYNRIAYAILGLDSYLDHFGLFECEPERSMGIHKMIVDNYVVCYVIDSGIVTVTDVLYGASNIHQRLQERRK